MRNKITDLVKVQTKHKQLPPVPPLAAAAFLVIDEHGVKVMEGKAGKVLDANGNQILGGVTVPKLGKVVFTGNFTATFTITATTNVTFPTAGTLATLAGTEALTGKTINGLTISTTTGTLSIATAKTLVVNNTLNLNCTDGATVTVPSTGTLSVVPSNVSLTTQGADISATTIASVAGLYRVAYDLQCTTQDAGAGTATLTFAFTDGVGSTTVASSAQSLTAIGRTQGTAFIQLASGNLTYAITHTGSYATAKYALYIVYEKLN